MKQLKITSRITNRETLSLEKYFQEIGKVSLITAEAESDLAKRIRNGDSIALDRMVRANLRFVVSVAKQYQNNGLPLGDLINEGNLGLIRAARRFDETRGFKFISYAVWWVRQAIMQALAEQARIVRLPLNRVGALYKIYRTAGVLEQEFHREPTTSELAAAMDVSEGEVELNLKNKGRHVSVDAPFSEGEENNLLDTLSSKETPTPDAELILESMKCEIQRALSGLSAREREVICGYYGLNGQPPMTLDEMGSRLRVNVCVK